MHVNIFFFFYTVSRCKGGHSKCLYARIHTVCISSAHFQIIHDITFFTPHPIQHFHSHPTDAEHQSLSNSVKQQVKVLNLSSHWPVWPRSLCGRLGLSSWVCVGPLQLSAPAFPPLTFRKQTVSLASTSTTAEVLQMTPLPSCFL